jgi:hypothetical protein
MPTPHGNMTLANVTVHDCRTCIETNVLGAHAYGANVSATAVSVDGCAGPGIDARRMKASGVSVTNASEIALWAEMKLTGDDIDVSGNSGRGIFAVSINAHNVVADGNGGDGVEAFGRIHIDGGEMLGNGGYDVVAKVAKLTGVTCGDSLRIASNPAESLGVCTND